MAAPPLALAPGEVHLWLALPDAIHDPALLREYHALMSPEEAAQQRRFYFERDRHTYLVSRALVRATLSRYAALAPAAWGFERNPYGRPEIAPPLEGLPLRFNLSHTHGLVAVGVALADDLGVDVEDTAREGEWLSTADRFFAPREAEALRALPASARLARFFDYWTLKESYIKARGLGLQIPLDSFAFLLDRPGSVRLHCDPSLGDDAGSWRFFLLQPTPRHRAAVAVRAPAGALPRLQIQRTVPLRGDSPAECATLRCSPAAPSPGD